MTNANYEIYALKYAGPFTRPASMVHWFQDLDKFIQINYYIFIIRGEDEIVLVDCGCRPKLAEERDFAGYVNPVDVLERIHIDSNQIKYLIGNGKDFEWGVDYVACGNYNFMKAQGAEEFAPYVCMSDIPLGDALGWGLIRTQTIADGCKTCDFRFKKAGKTKISSKTPAVQATIEKIQYS